MAKKDDAVPEKKDDAVPEKKDDAVLEKKETNIQSLDDWISGYLNDHPDVTFEDDEAVQNLWDAALEAGFDDESLQDFFMQQEEASNEEEPEYEIGESEVMATPDKETLDQFLGTMKYPSSKIEEIMGKLRGTGLSDDDIMSNIEGDTTDDIYDILGQYSFEEEPEEEITVDEEKGPIKSDVSHEDMASKLAQSILGGAPSGNALAKLIGSLKY